MRHETQQMGISHSEREAELRQQSQDVTYLH